MGKRQTLSDWLNDRYNLVIRKEDNFEIMKKMSFSYGKLIVFGLLGAAFLFFAALFVSRTFLGVWFDPSYESLKNRQQLMMLSQAIDSLEYTIETKDRFIDNFQMLVSGEVPNEEFQDGNGDTLAIKAASLESSEKLKEVDRQFREEFDGKQITQMDNYEMGYSEMQELFFIKPVDGMVSSPFDQKIDHFGVDVVTKEHEAVKAVADGTVLLSGWTQEEGYVVMLQHKNNLVSVYKHNSEILVKQGQIVSAGDVIGIVGNSGDLTTGPHLHFELWFNGNPVNPRHFVSFN
ncbi:M23 family metallopeptidase [Aureibacter tunicatorum]|uniref:Murein DD-endopeptidase MepM/ murein hydrolase activator NlpD n=1 Tax=Aureibacter tunicatorum TaxID=866807 RepID=A0AAE3XIT1_9BACT|nr:M23 family metallopeptidase [Aureibacter tunicatorum]MDR6237200.1 murein DD-endopeptidase MepM/ murein hydrolase activator NlpD [Aureibacter tunicatorum]